MPNSCPIITSISGKIIGLSGPRPSRFEWSPARLPLVTVGLCVLMEAGSSPSQCARCPPSVRGEAGGVAARSRRTPVGDRPKPGDRRPCRRLSSKTITEKALAATDRQGGHQQADAEAVPVSRNTQIAALSSRCALGRCAARSFWTPCRRTTRSFRRIRFTVVSVDDAASAARHRSAPVPEPRAHPRAAVIQRPLVCRCCTRVVRVTGAVSSARHSFAGPRARHPLPYQSTSTTRRIP